MLEPVLALEKGDKGRAEVLVPTDYELEHLTKELSIFVRVEKSDITGLFLQVEGLNSEDQKKWDRLLKHLEDRLGKTARLHPRITIPEFNLGLSFLSGLESKGKIFDISVGGMKILSDIQVAPLETILFQFQIPETITSLSFAQGMSWQGIVRRCEQRGFGLEFVENPSFREKTKKLVDVLAKLRMQRLQYPRYVIYDFGVAGVLRSEYEEASQPVVLKDISISGSYLLIERMFPIDQPVTLEIRPNPNFSNLYDSLELRGRVLRGTPDGLVVTFSDLAKNQLSRLSGWIDEIAARYRGEAKIIDETKIVPKATLSVAYGSDLLFIHEYLYNLSAGGLLMPGVPFVNKGDVINFVLDLSGTSLAENFPEPPNFQATVVRTTEQGFGVQFSNPDEIRAQLDSVMGNLLRKEPTRKFWRLHETATKLYRKIEGRRFQFSFRLLSPSVTTVSLMSAGIAILLVLTYLQSEVKPRETVESLASPQVVRVVDKNRVREIVIGDVVDATFDKENGIRVILKDGTSVSGESLVGYLSLPLREKLETARQDVASRETEASLPKERSSFTPPPAHYVEKKPLAPPPRPLKMQ
ncbi:MAG TPA: PilZ domain-containing protein [Bdellovibrionota bacterium]|nr:PilZ domain-containing protein [Bdellovibrionota bacterium]